MSKTNILPSIFGAVSEVIQMDKFWQLFKGKERLKLEFLQEVEKRSHEINLKQIEVNISESKHRSIWVAGWRPAIGWVGALALFYNFVARDFICYAMRVLGSQAELPPDLEIGQLIVILTGMLGFGVARTVERLKGKS